ncbi:MAG: hypothetical protein QNJ89_02495 [Acidimicrobiia bacterium]|nr:hypothetical protein [Acidimicrobiia bacterium]
MSKRLPAFAVLAIGVIVLIVLFASNLFTVGTAFEELTDAFRPIMTEEAIAAAEADVAGLGAVADEFTNDVAPAVAQSLQMSPEELGAFLGTNYPAVAAGVAALPAIVPRFTEVVELLAAQQANFESADAIPTTNLPASTVPWMILLIGVAAVGVAIYMLGPSERAWLMATIFGVLVVALSLLLSFLPKSSAADDLNDALRPKYNAELVADARQAVGVISAMGKQMQAELLPDLAAQLQMSESQMVGFLGQFPATEAALGGLGDSLDRFGSMVTAFDSQLDNYNTIKGTELYPIALLILMTGLLVIACGVWRFVVDRRAESTAALEGSG